ncbi:ABC transporter permease [Leekyejoonella antrihumi]|uniref:Iron ABC transporter permease n=1 Tax=Leekyejoonella antrihumi TaxID=1660198 RepID=A0A563E185_9MICO|nr:iron ABC transporter permease [Leekyejoonella antrihumi]TWP35932.1 iron ABC transporter permease [Leekyejoonella antrihumi]
MLLPLVLVGLDANSAGWREISTVLFRARSAILLWHTVELMAVVVVAAGALGIASAWATQRCALPLRRLWTVLLVLPIAMPDFVVGYTWHTLWPGLNPLLGSAAVMTLGTYPLVYLPVAAALRRSDPVLEDTARGLAAGRLKTFWRISLPQIRVAATAGSVLVVLTVISEYGAFEVLRFSTFTTEIFTEFQIDPASAGALSIPLVLIGLLVLAAEALLLRRQVSATRSVRYPPPRGHWSPRILAVMAGLVVPVGLGVALPVATLIYWIQRGQHTTLPAAATLGQATWASVSYSALGAAVAVAAALPVALLTFRRRSSVRTLIDRSCFVTQAVPGVVVALSLVFLATRYLYSLYQSGPLLVAAYAILHFPLALACIKGATAAAPARLYDMATSLGRHPVAAFLRVTLPLMAPGLLAGFCLVFLTAITELTATLVLAPIGVSTLATQFWAFQSEVAYSAAAPYALAIVVIAVVPGALLGLWFDRDNAAVQGGPA